MQCKKYWLCRELIGIVRAPRNRLFVSFCGCRDASVPDPSVSASLLRAAASATVSDDTRALTVPACALNIQGAAVPFCLRFCDRWIGGLLYLLKEQYVICFTQSSSRHRAGSRRCGLCRTDCRAEGSHTRCHRWSGSDGVRAYRYRKNR